MAAPAKAAKPSAPTIIERGVRFNDALNGDDLQARIDAAALKADEMQTPWFVADYMHDDETVRESIEGMARCDAEDALYAEPNDPRVVVLG